MLFLSYSPDDPAMEICSSPIGQLILGGIIIMPYNRFLYSTCHDGYSALMSYKDCEKAVNPSNFAPSASWGNLIQITYGSRPQCAGNLR
jgi:hypothetical protein